MKRRQSRRSATLDGTLVLAVGASLLVGLLFGLETSTSTDPGIAADPTWKRRGDIVVGPLTIKGATIDMGDVALEVTHLPAWTIANPTSEVVALRIAQPQVVLGCCPGPIVVNGTVIDPGALVRIPAGEHIELVFPLRMHDGMDGPHHLLIPLEAEGDRATLGVIGDFTNTARR